MKHWKKYELAPPPPSVLICFLFESNAQFRVLRAATALENFVTCLDSSPCISRAFIRFLNSRLMFFFSKSWKYLRACIIDSSSISSVFKNWLLTKWKFVRAPPPIRPGFGLALFIYLSGKSLNKLLPLHLPFRDIFTGKSNKFQTSATSG